MTTQNNKRVNAVIDAIAWQLDGTGIIPGGLAQNAVHAVDGADKKAGRVSVDIATLNEIKEKLTAISSRSTADLQTVMWAKQAIKLLDNVK